MESYATLWAMPEEAEVQEFPRTAGYRPPEEENPHNAWYWRAEIAGRPSGLLSGLRVAVKDNVCVAGLPMMNGSRALEGFVPSRDATVVRRILEQGGTLMGKATNEDLCLSGGSWNTALGPVTNPWNTKHSAGGSSSGSAVLVATREVDLAIGGDQGGSIRIPAACCGLVGLKPTWGLVPYTGILPIETTLDHTGPIARSVQDCALFLEAIAGFDDNRDMRQPSFGFTCPKFTEEMEKPMAAGRNRIGVLKEGFSIPDKEVVSVVEKAVEALRAAKIFTILDVSLPEHLNCGHISAPIAIQGSGNQMIQGAEAIVRSLEPLENTQAFDFTHHPALTLNAGFSESGLPVGLMLVGKHWKDGELLRMGAQVEASLAHLQTRSLPQ